MDLMKKEEFKKLLKIITDFQTPIAQKKQKQIKKKFIKVAESPIYGKKGFYRGEILNNKPNGYGIFMTKNKKYKVGVINLMGNVFMRKTEDVFKTAKIIREKIKLKKNVDFIIVDFHGEITSEKMAIGHFFDGLSTVVVGTHTHVPTADTRILDKGTGYQTDIGMCGDYNSVIGMNKENSIKKFFKDKTAINHFPSEGEGTLSGIVIDANPETGLTKKITRIIQGGSLTK